jgi:hypothetical protein
MDKLKMQTANLADEYFADGLAKIEEGRVDA